MLTLIRGSVVSSDVTGLVERKISTAGPSRGPQEFVATASAEISSGPVIRSQAEPFKRIRSTGRIIHRRADMDPSRMLFRGIAPKNACVLESTTRISRRRDGFSERSLSGGGPEERE